MRLAFASLMLSSCQLVYPLDGDPFDNSGANRVFVTSRSFNADLGGVEGADQKCRDAASDAGLGGTYVAWVSSDIEPVSNAIDRLDGARGWIRIDGRPVADRVTDLISRGPFHPIAITENGDDVRGNQSMVFTGTANGVAAVNRSCAGWTTTNLGTVFRAGDAAKAGIEFGDIDEFDNRGCGVVANLYCFGIDVDVQVRVQPAQLPIAFVSERVLAPAGGIPAADAICEEEARDAGLAGVFRAALATSIASILSRFDNGDREYMRVDGVPIGRLLSATLLETAVVLTAAGQPVNTDARPFTGGRPGAMPAGGETCSDWTGSSNVVLGDALASDGRAWTLSPVPCNTPQRVFCLED